MPLIIPQMLLALAVIATFAAGIWLMINARSVARVFRGNLIDPGPGPRLASRRTVLAIITAFVLGFLASIAIWSWAMTDEAADAVQTGEFRD